MSSLTELYAVALPQEMKDVIRKLQTRIQQLESERDSYVEAYHRIDKQMSNAEHWISDITPKLSNFGLAEGLDYEPYSPPGT